MSSVTPTRSPSSLASARVKPTTPNLLAQYAVAAGSARRPSVEATVTTRPCERSSAGSAARTTAAVPRRLTITTRSQASGSTSRMSPQASVPAAVTTPSSPPCSSAAARTAASASRGRERSAAKKGNSSAGGRRSRTTGVPPPSWTAAATAAPSPDAPPVTSTVPSGLPPPFSCASVTDDLLSGAARLVDSVSSVVAHGGAPSVAAEPPRRSRGRPHRRPAGRSPCGGDLVARAAARLVDQPRRGPAGDVRHEDGAAAPLGQRLGLGQIGDGVVAPLRPQVRAQLAQDRARVVLLEHRDGVHAGERAQHGRAVVLADERPVRPLEAAHGGVRVEADDQAVAEGARGLERPHVAGVEEVEAAARRDDRAAAGPDARGQRRRGRVTVADRLSAIACPRRGAARRDE